MLTDLLFITVFFLTRIVVPLAVTYVIGIGIEYALNRAPRAQAPRTAKWIERHALSPASQANL